MIDGALLLILAAAIGGPVALNLHRRWAQMQVPKEESDAAGRLERSLWALAKASGASPPSLRDGTYAIERLDLPEARVRLESALLDHRGTVELRVSGPMPTGSLTFYADQLRLGPHGRAFIGDGDVATSVRLGAFLIRFAPRTNAILVKIVGALAARNQGISLIGMSRGRLEVSAELPASSWAGEDDLDRVCRLLARVYDALAHDWSDGRQALLARFSGSDVSPAWEAWTRAASRHGALPHDNVAIRHALATTVDPDVAALALTAEDVDLEAPHLETDRLYALILAANALAPLDEAPPRRALLEGAMRRVIGTLDLELLEALVDLVYDRLDTHDAALLAASVPRAATRFVSRWLADVADTAELDALIGSCIGTLDAARLPALLDQLLRRATSWPKTLSGLATTRLDAAAARSVTAPLISTAQSATDRLPEEILFVAVSALYHAQGAGADAIGDLLVAHAHTPAPIARLRALAQGSPGITPDGARAAKAALERIEGAAVSSGRAGGLELSSGRGGELSQTHTRGGDLTPSDA